MSVSYTNDRKMSEANKLGIVTVLYNSESVLEGFFASLEGQTCKDFILYVIDNASADRSLDMAKHLASRSSFLTRFICNKQNFGVAKGNNQGIAAAMNEGCSHILLANNDIEFGDDVIELLMAKQNATNACMIVPKILFYGTNLIWSAGGAFTYKNACTIQYGYKEQDKQAYAGEYWVEYVPTCFVLIKTEVFQKVGLMDETYFVYYDDTDFMYRALKKGIRTLYYGTPVIYHKESTCTGSVSGFRLRFLTRNSIYFAYKNFSVLYFIYILLYITCRTFTTDMLRYKGKNVSIACKAIVEGMKLCFVKEPCNIRK